MYISKGSNLCKKKAGKKDLKSILDPCRKNDLNPIIFQEKDRDPDLKILNVWSFDEYFYSVEILKARDLYES